MGIAPVKAWLSAVVTLAELVDGQATASGPEFTLSWAAREYDVREFLDLLPYRRICCLPQPRSTVAGSARPSDAAPAPPPPPPRHSDENIGLRPIAPPQYVSELVEIDLKLGGAVGEGG